MAHKTKKPNWIVRFYKKSPLIFIGIFCLMLIFVLAGSAGIYHHHVHDEKLNHLQRIERISDRKERRVAHERNKQ